MICKPGRRNGCMTLIQEIGARAAVASRSLQLLISVSAQLLTSSRCPRVAPAGSLALHSVLPACCSSRWPEHSRALCYNMSVTVWLQAAQECSRDGGNSRQACGSFRALLSGGARGTLALPNDALAVLHEPRHHAAQPGLRLPCVAQTVAPVVRAVRLF